MWAVAENIRRNGSPDPGRADIRDRSKGGFTPLMFAARVGDVESAKILLSAARI